MSSAKPYNNIVFPKAPIWKVSRATRIQTENISLKPDDSTSKKYTIDLIILE